jgi:hypothetical protein
VVARLGTDPVAISSALGATALFPAALAVSYGGPSKGSRRSVRGPTAADAQIRRLDGSGECGNTSMGSAGPVDGAVELGPDPSPVRARYRLFLFFVFYLIY